MREVFEDGEAPVFTQFPVRGRLFRFLHYREHKDPDLGDGEELHSDLHGDRYQDKKKYGELTQEEAKQLYEEMMAE